MSNPLADRFTDALGHLEAHRDLDLIAALFADDAEIGNVVVPEKFQGPQGARQFWTKYRDTFDTVTSTFRNRIIEDGRIALEWTTEATSTGGKEIHYEGVSVLETTGDKISRFHAYFDSGALGRQMETDETNVVQL